jgi:hydrogenase maturation protease
VTAEPPREPDVRPGADVRPEPDVRPEAAEPPGEPDGHPVAAGVLVVGYGNALRSDDAVGLHAAGLLARDPRLARAQVLARHQLTPELALDISRASLVVLIDASLAAAPGDVIVRAAGSDADRGRAEGAPGGTTHHVGVDELVALATALYDARPEVVVVGVGVASLETGDALSPEVAAALPEVVEIVAGLVARHRG